MSSFALITSQATTCRNRSGRYNFLLIEFYHRQEILSLSYSMLNKDDIPTEHLSLNDLITELKAQIQEDDSAKKVTIECANLPAVNVIKIQFQQLLLNILNIAIKYSKPEEDAIIEIYCEHIPAIKMSEEEAISGKNYLKIIIADNGIGFEQDYSGKIFGLFQRLHTKDEYDGTGI
jgi:light-regulated signal transduction histidine kinase (bacteriophytochrome)